MQTWDDRPAALVIGQANPNLLGQARALGRSGVRVVALLTRGEIPTVVRSSRFVHKVIDARKVTDTELVSVIRDLAKTEQQKPVLFFAGDFDVDRIAGIWHSISDLLTPTTPPEKASLLGTKDRQLEVMAEAGIPLPAGRNVKTEEQLDSAISELRFPLIIRPVGHMNRGSFPGKVLVSSSRDEIEATMCPVLQAGGVTLLVQEYIPGGTETVHFALAHCSPEGNVHSIVTGHKCLERPEGRTNIGKTRIDKDVESLARRVFKAFGVGGVLGVEFKKDPRDGTLAYIETNFRPDNFVAIAEAAGINLVLDAYLESIGRLSEFQPGLQREVVWWDYSLLLAQGVSGTRFRKVATERRKLPVVDAVWSRDDLLPGFLWYLLKFGKPIWQGMRKKLYAVRKA